MPAHVVSAFWNNVALVLFFNSTDESSIFISAGDNSDVVFFFQVDLEAEDLISFESLYFLAVDIESDFVEVRIDFDGCFLIGAIDVSLGADMDKGIFTPVGFVGVESIFFGLAVKGD